jgi:protein-L-isoaspartate(D-aspartate) O-methyltransferase
MGARAVTSVGERSAERERMIAGQIEARGVTAPRVLEALRRVAREDFVPPALARFAYDDGPLPIGVGQTISQPYIVAAMIAAARVSPGDRVLEIGTGSGYGAAVLSRIAGEVFTVERIEALADATRSRLVELGYTNVHVLAGDGSLGWPEHAPYDAIVVTAAGPKVPRPLLSQLASGGRLVMPVGETQGGQSPVRVVRADEHEYEYEDLEEVAFVPLIGAEGWSQGG